MTAIRKKLLRWYDQAARDLPWRQTRDPYAIWLSEVMLQQTRVETVIPYYQRFLESFPTVRALAKADEDAVLSHWSGLGYYRRARLLHAGVREVVAQYGGEVPEDLESRRALPGVGRYTAGAIGSIAFDKEEPIVDGNVSRVLARLFRIDTPIGASVTNRRLWEEAGRLVPGARPGAFNQALMELGAMICTSKRPSCESCPLANDCEARARGEVDVLPVPRPRKVPREVELAAVVATRGRSTDQKVWLVRSEQSLFAGLWGLPTIARKSFDESDARNALRDAGISARFNGEPTRKVEHVLTHRRMRIEVFRATGANGTASKNRRLFSTDDLAKVGVSTLTRKLLGGSLTG